MGPTKVSSATRAELCSRLSTPILVALKFFCASEASNIPYLNLLARLDFEVRRGRHWNLNCPRVHSCLGSSQRLLSCRFLSMRLLARLGFSLSLHSPQNLD